MKAIVSFMLAGFSVTLYINFHDIFAVISKGFL